MRGNGAVQDGASGFAVGDLVFVMKKFDSKKVYVIGHVEGVKNCEFYLKCTFNGNAVIKGGEIVKLANPKTGSDNFAATLPGGLCGPFPGACIDSYPRFVQGGWFYYYQQVPKEQALYRFIATVSDHPFFHIPIYDVGVYIPGNPLFNTDIPDAVADFYVTAAPHIKNPVKVSNSLISTLSHNGKIYSVREVNFTGIKWIQRQEIQTVVDDYSSSACFAIGEPGPLSFPYNVVASNSGLPALGHITCIGDGVVFDMIGLGNYFLNEYPTFLIVLSDENGLGPSFPKQTFSAAHLIQRGGLYVDEDCTNPPRSLPDHGKPIDVVENVASGVSQIIEWQLIDAPGIHPVDGTPVF